MRRLESSRNRHLGGPFGVAAVRSGPKTVGMDRTRADEPPLSMGMDVWERARAHDLSGLSAELAYRFLFAIFPFGLFLAATASFAAGALGLANPTSSIIDGLGDNLPPELAGVIRPELEQVLGQPRFGLVSFGALVALWAATTGTMTVIKAMNRAYGVNEDRPIVRRYALGLALTIAGSIGVVVAFVTVVGGAFLTDEFADRVGLGAAWGTLSIIRWPIVFAILVVAAAIVYRVGPNLQPSWRAALTGAAVFAVGWIVATFAFAQYVTRVADYGATYGALGGVIVLMVWLYLTGLILLVGAEVVAILVGRAEPERLEARRTETAAADIVDGVRQTARRTLGRVTQAAAPDGERSPSGQGSTRGV
jgi:membrane protein